MWHVITVLGCSAASLHPDYSDRFFGLRSSSPAPSGVKMTSQKPRRFSMTSIPWEASEQRVIIFLGLTCGPAVTALLRQIDAKNDVFEVLCNNPGFILIGLHKEP